MVVVEAENANVYFHSGVIVKKDDHSRRKSDVAFEATLVSAGKACSRAGAYLGLSAAHLKLDFVEEAEASVFAEAHIHSESGHALVAVAD